MRGEQVRVGSHLFAITNQVWRKPSQSEGYAKGILADERDLDGTVASDGADTETPLDIELGVPVQSDERCARR